MSYHKRAAIRWEKMLERHYDGAGNVT